MIIVVHINILLHSDYLQLICIFLDLKDLLTKFVLLSKFYYMFINSNDDNRLKRRIFDTCLNYTFPNFLNNMKINKNNFKTNAIYQRYISKLLTNWKYFIKVQGLLHNIPPNGRGNHDLYSLVSCDNSSIIIYWLKRVCLCFEAVNVKDTSLFFCFMTILLLHKIDLINILFCNIDSYFILTCFCRPY